MNADSFYWRVGQDSRIFKSKEFYLNFGHNYHLQPINVEVIALKKSECFERRDCGTKRQRSYVPKQPSVIK